MVYLKTFSLLGFVFVYLKTFLLLSHTCVPQDIFITITQTVHIITHSSLPSIHYITQPLPSATLIYLSHPWMTNVPSFGVMSTHGFAVYLKTFLSLSFFFVYLQTFLLLGYTCVPQDIFITITQTGHIITHSSLPSIHYITRLLPSATLIYLSSPWMTNVPSFGVMSTNGFAHNLALLLVHGHISCWGMIHQAERFKIMPSLNHVQSFLSQQCTLCELAHIFFPLE